MSDMKDSGVKWIGQVPREWKISRLKYNIDCFDGKRIPIDSALREEGPYPYWGAGNITDYVNDYIFNEELVLLGEDGAPFFDDFRPVAFLVNEPIWVNNHIHVLKGNKNVLNKFLTYFLNIVKYDVYINGSIINKLTQGNMNNINILIPLIEEQQLIIEFLDDKVERINEVLRDLNNQVDILNKYKKSLIDSTVTCGVTSNVEKQKIRIGRLVDLKQGIAINAQSNHLVSEKETSLALLRIADMNSGNKEVFMKEKTPKQYIANKNDLIYTRTGQIGLVFTNQEGVVHNNCFRVIPKTEKQLSRKFLYWVLKSDKFYKYANILAVGSAQPDLSHTSFNEIDIMLFPLKEQELIADFLEKECNKINLILQHKLLQTEKMEKYKKSLIYEYVTGKKRVKGAEELYG